jgi:hypothetical protein
MSDPANSLYEVVYSDYQRGVVRTLGKTAAKRGLRAVYLTAVRSMHYHMETDPLTWGDLQNRLHHLQLLLCHGIQSPLHVYYAVDEARRIVYVQEIKPLPGRGLEEAE